MTLNPPTLPKLSKIPSGVKPCQLSMMSWLRMEHGNLFYWILLTISLDASECFTLNIYPITLLIGIKFVLLQKVFIVLAWTITTPLVWLSSPPLYALFSILQQAEVGPFISLMSIRHFFKVHYSRMSICFNLLPLLIETPLTLYAKSIMPFMASGRPPPPPCLVP